MKKFYLISGLILIIGIIVFSFKLNDNKIGVESFNEDINNIVELGNLNVNSDVNTTKEYKISTYITDDIKENTQTGKFSASLKKEYTPQYMDELSDNVALVRIISLDGASLEYNSMVGMTYGKMLINTSLKGDLKEGEVVEYLKPGGVVSVAEYEKYDDPAAIEKREYLRKQNGIKIDKENSYYEIILGNDIIIEEGKTYLAYLKYSNDFKKYEIVGFGNGLREVVNILKETKNVKQIELNVNDLKIKNNNTNEVESLQEYVNKNVKIK